MSGRRSWAPLRRRHRRRVFRPHSAPAAPPPAGNRARGARSASNTTLAPPPTRRPAPTPRHRRPHPPPQPTLPPLAGMARLHAWAGCSLELHAYHLLYVAAVTALVVGGSLWAWAFDTSGYHLRFGHLDPLDLLHLAPSSSPTAHSRFLPPPYLFAQKHNPFNVYFVKLGWAWNIALWAVQFLLLRATYSVALKERDLRRRRRLDKLVRHKYRQLRRQLEAENASADPLVDESLSRVQGASSVVQLHPGDMSIASATSPRRRQLQPQQQEMLLKQALAVLHKERERERHQGPQFVTAPFRASITRLVLATACWCASFYLPVLTNASISSGCLLLS